LIAKLTFANISVNGLHRSRGYFLNSLRSSSGNLSAQYSDTYLPPCPSKIANNPQFGSPTLSTQQCTNKIR